MAMVIEIKQFEGDRFTADIRFPGPSNLSGFTMTGSLTEQERKELNDLTTRVIDRIKRELKGSLA